MVYFCFFFNDTATTEIYTLSLHDALPICPADREGGGEHQGAGRQRDGRAGAFLARIGQGDADLHRHVGDDRRSEEHTSELQSRRDLVCRLLLEKKKKKNIAIMFLNTYRSI